ncbi:hypothetical protein, secreted, partial [gut metagenome]
MKKEVSVVLLSALLLSGCASGRMGHPGAIMAGASIGGSLGNSIGGLIGDNQNPWIGGYRGSAIGNIVGTLAGAAIGNALSQPRKQEMEEGAYVPEVREVREVQVKKQKHQPQVSQAFARLRIDRICFIDDNCNHEIDAGENSKIIFEVINEGSEPVCNVVPVVKTMSKAKHIHISPSAMVEQILPGEGIRYTASVHAGERLKKG